MTARTADEGLEEAPSSGEGVLAAAPPAPPPERPLGHLFDAIQTRSSSRTLPPPLRTRMESAFGTDFSGIRVHETRGVASLGIDALTQGEHLHFEPGRYKPGSVDGQKLIGHELAHVVQQRLGRVAAPGDGGLPLNTQESLEREADVQGARAARDLPARPEGLGPVHASPGLGPAPIQGGRTGVRIKIKDRRIKKKWVKKSSSVKPGYVWADKDEFIKLHKAKRTRSDKLIDPKTGTKYYRGKSGKLYQNKLKPVRRTVDRTTLKAKNSHETYTDPLKDILYKQRGEYYSDSGFTTKDTPADPKKLTSTGTIHAEPQPDKRYYKQGGKYYSDAAHTTEAKPTDESALKATTHPDEFDEPQPDKSYFKKGEDYYSDSGFTTKATPADASKLTSTGTVHAEPQPDKRYYKQGGKYYSDAAHTTEAKPADESALKATTHPDEFDEPQPDKTYFRQNDRYYSDTAFTHEVKPPDASQLYKDTSKAPNAYIQRSNRKYYKRGGTFFKDKTFTTPEAPPDPSRLLKHPVPMEDTGTGDVYYESDGGEFYEDRPKLAVKRRKSAELWDLTRPDRERLEDETLGAFEKRALADPSLQMHPYDVDQYEQATKRHRTLAKSENDHAPADKSLKIKTAKERGRNYKAGGKTKVGAFQLHIPGRTSFTSGIEDVQKQEGWSQNIPGSLHEDYSPTFRFRQQNQDTVNMIGGTTYTANRPEVDAEIPATALHRDKESLMQGMEATGELDPQSFGGVRTHIKRAYEHPGLIPANALGFTFVGDPLAKKTAGGGLTYTEHPAKTQAELTDEMLNEYLKKSLTSP